MDTIILKEIIGPLLQTRQSARALGELIEKENTHQKECTLDFTDVTFMSRTFADEVCSILDQNPHVRVINMNPSVKTLFEIVREGRWKLRHNTSTDAEVLTFNDMESLREFLSKI